MYNGFPTPLQCQLGPRPSTSDDGGPNPQPAGPTTSVGPGAEAPLDAAMDAREGLAFRLASAHEAGVSPDAAHMLDGVSPDLIRQASEVSSSGDGSVDAGPAAGGQAMDRRGSGWGWGGWLGGGGVVAGRDGWTPPLDIRGRGTPSQYGRGGGAALPECGQKVALRLLHRGNLLGCVLMAEPQAPVRDRTFY
jgi:hypothetical protein